MLTGPESCGKTTLATALSDSLRAPMVPEVSRDYLNQQLSRDSHFQYSEPDLLEIASQQHSLERQALTSQPDILISDTDLLVLIIWSEVRFGHCHQWILDTFEKSITEDNRHYLLCDHHIPWQPDSLRENADSRGELFELYRQKLEHYGLNFTLVEGDIQRRLAETMALIEHNLTAH